MKMKLAFKNAEQRRAENNFGVNKAYPIDMLNKNGALKAKYVKLSEVERLGVVSTKTEASRILEEYYIQKNKALKISRLALAAQGF